jgi:chromosome segregation ATPase
LHMKAHKNSLLTSIIPLYAIAKGSATMLIQEVILENFMSYEYARIPFHQGVNLVCGPNGAGKSSILLGISVALGQSYTERSRKLSDLIRWGKDQARVAVVLDNTPSMGRRPIPRIDKDQIFLTRGLRKDGKYWFELDNKAATKQDVERLLSKLGLDPDNMVILMHQAMTEQFIALSPAEKLRMVEAAVGFESYRRNVADAQRKLSRVLSEEESVGKLLESAEQTLSYWREQYDRYQLKKQLIMKRKFLERELAWAHVAKRERAVTDIQNEMQNEQSEIERLEDEAEKVQNGVDEAQSTLNEARLRWTRLFEERLGLEREKAKHESRLTLSNQTLKETQSWSEAHQDASKDYLNKLEQLQNRVSGEVNPADLRAEFTEVRKTYEQIQDAWINRVQVKNESLRQQIEMSNQQLTELEEQITEVEARANKLDSEMSGTSQKVLDDKIRLALLQHEKESLQKALQKLGRDLQTARHELDSETKRAEETGARIAAIKSAEEIIDEIRLTDGHIVALADVSEDIERMYESYSKLYLELKDKAQLVAENRDKALAEVRTRMEAWHDVIQTLLDHVNVQYQTILGNAQAQGEVRLSNDRDIEAAGLQIYVGFKGAKAMPLDAYTQSGGERSTATMMFLLALQQHVRSPFRAVDEYDMHMDPKNREVIAHMMVSSVDGSDSQYLVITPSQVTFAQKDVNIITVQNMEGTSVVKEVH